MLPEGGPGGGGGPLSFSLLFATPERTPEKRGKNGIEAPPGPLLGARLGSIFAVFSVVFLLCFWYGF